MRSETISDEFVRPACQAGYHEPVAVFEDIPKEGPLPRGRIASGQNQHGFFTLSP